MQTGICLQIGLFLTAEYHYLVLDNWKEHSDETLKAIFPDRDQWEYYGVDCDPLTLHYVVANYENAARVNWVCAAVKYGVPLIKMASPHRNIEPEEKAMYTDGKDLIHSEYYTPCFSLKALVDALNLSTVDILIMDIEGDEFAVLDSGDLWEVSPRFIDIEMHFGDTHRNQHFFRDANTFENMFQTHGYRCISRKNQNEGQQVLFQFVKI